MFKNTIRTKILSIFGIMFIVVVLANYVMTVRANNEKSIEMVVTQAQELTMTLEKVRNHMGALFSGGYYNMDSLMQDLDAYAAANTDTSEATMSALPVMRVKIDVTEVSCGL